MSLFPRLVANEFAPMFRLMDDYASHVATRGWPAQSLSSSFRSWQPRFDIRESKDGYELHGELPGIEQNDLSIEFTDARTLSIKGRTERSREEGTKPAAALETSQAEPQQQIEDSDSSKYQKATVEDEAGPSAANADAQSATTAATEGIATPATETASEAPAQQTASQPKVEGPKYWLSERSVGEFSRSFSFPDRVDVERVSASLKNGILSILVPKAAAPVARRINVE